MSKYQPSLKLTLEDLTIATIIKQDSFQEDDELNDTAYNKHHNSTRMIIDLFSSQDKKEAKKRNERNPGNHGNHGTDKHEKNHHEQILHTDKKERPEQEFKHILDQLEQDNNYYKTDRKTEKKNSLLNQKKIITKPFNNKAPPIRCCHCNYRIESALHEKHEENCSVNKSNHYLSSSNQNKTNKTNNSNLNKSNKSICF